MAYSFAPPASRSNRSLVCREERRIGSTDSPQTREGRYNLDPRRRGFGYGVDGAMARFVRVPARCLHRLPGGLPFELAALTEPCCVAYQAVVVNSRIRPGDVVAVIGPGPIGLLCAQVARVCGAAAVVVAGLARDRARLDLGLRLGATHVVDAETQDLSHAVRGLGDGQGADLVVDASGASAALAQAMASVRPGGQITKVGWVPQPLGLSLDPKRGRLRPTRPYATRLGGFGRR